MLLSSSRDKTLIIWNLTRDESAYGYPKRSLHGHSHIVSDCVSTGSYYQLDQSSDMSKSRSFPLTVPTPYQHPGTRLSVCGSFRRATPRVPLLAIPMMSSQSPSLPTTDKLFQVRETERSSCGILLETANSQSPTKATLSGYHV